MAEQGRRQYLARRVASPVIFNPVRKIPENQRVPASEVLQFLMNKGRRLKVVSVTPRTIFIEP